MRIWFVHEGRGEHLFCPRRAAKEHEELQRQHICPRRTRRAAENCNGDCNFLLSTEGREGPRRKPLPIIIWSRRDVGNTFVHEGPRRNTKNCNGNTFVHGGHGGPRRTATATATSFCPRRAAKGHEENLCQIIIWSVHEGTRGTPFLSTKGTKNTKNCNGNTFVHGGHGGPRRTATATATSFCPRRAVEGPRSQRDLVCSPNLGPRRDARTLILET